MFNLSALYEALKSDLQVTINRTTAYDHESVPLHVKRHASLYMVEKFLTKLQPDASDELDQVAFNSFMESNELCSKWSLPELSSSDEQLVGEFAKIMEDFFLQDLGADCDLNWGNISLHARCGPGSAVGAHSTSYYGKMFSGPLTAWDPMLIDLYRAECSLDPEASNAEIIRQENFGSSRASVSSSASFVPKTAKTSRMIDVQPTLNAYYQLGLGAIIEKRLKRFFNIDLSEQASVNRWLAFVGSSVDSTFGDGFATIDLTEASNSIALRFCSHFIPAEWFSTLVGLRCPQTRVKLGKKSYDVALEMMSTMGNGYTFPLQTAIFACIAASSVSNSDDIRSRPRGFGFYRPGSFSVFGDDIVVPASEFERTCRLLRILGFRPNPEKSFGSGSFRESCGHDYYHGYNIRPVFVRKVKTDTDLVVLVNLLVEWSARLEIQIPNAIEYLLRNIRFVNLVPMCEGMDAGIRVPYSVAVRFRGSLPNRKKGEMSLAYIKRYAHIKRVRISDGRITTPVGTKRFIYNPSGLMMSYLRGEIRNGSISLRNWSPVYRTKRAVCHNWNTVQLPLEAAFTGTAPSPDVLARRTHMILSDILPGIVKG